MADTLSPHEKNFLRDLKTHPEWQSILDKLAQRRQDLRYKPKGDVEEAKKIHEWILQSGRSRENEEIINLLSLE